MAARPRIVLADDELNLRKVLGAILARDGYEVLEARDGEEALALVNQHSPGIAALITDLRMPRLDGMGLLRRVVAEHPDIPVVMITAHGSVDSAVEAVKMGAFDYIEKPFEQDAHPADRAPRRSRRSSSTSARRGRSRPRRACPDASGSSDIRRAWTQIFPVIEKVADTPTTVS